MAAPRKELSKNVTEVVIPLYLSGLKQGEISRRLKIPRTTITSVIDRFRKRGRVDNIPRKGKQPKFDDRDTRQCMKKKTEREVWRMSLLCLIEIGNQPFLNELFRELCTSRNILGELYGNISEFEKLIVKPDFPGVEITGTVEYYWNRVIFTDEFKMDIDSDSQIFIWWSSAKTGCHVFLHSPQRQSSV